MDNITTIAQMLSTPVQQALAASHSLADIEQETRRLMQEVGRPTVAAVVNGQEARYPEPELPCPHCGARTTYIRPRTAQLRTLLGDLEVKRAYYLCCACHKGYYPLDRRLGLRPKAITYGAKGAEQEAAGRTVAYDQAALPQRQRTARRPLRL